MIDEIKRWAEVVRDIGLILGVPTLIIVGVKLYGQQIDALKARAEFLKETQFDRAATLIKSQKEVYQLDLQALEERISKLQGSLSEKAEALVDREAEIEKLQTRRQEVTDTIQSLDRSISVIDRASFAQALFREDAIFRQSRFDRRVDFSESLFNDDVSFARSLFQASAVFIDAAFRGRAVFDGADMRRASFKGTDLRGVDLSEAITDSTTKFPNRLQP